MKRFGLVLLLAALTLPLTGRVSADGYSIAELRDEGSTPSPPFSIARVATYPGGLRLFLSTADPDGLASLLTSSALEAQLSDHSAETALPVMLSLGKAVWCAQDSDPSYLAYSDPLPACGCQPPARIEYFVEAAVTLGIDRDLAIGEDPDFLWLIEEQ
jgi:hypothetical protein